MEYSFVNWLQKRLAQKQQTRLTLESAYYTHSLAEYEVLVEGILPRPRGGIDPYIYVPQNLGDTVIFAIHDILRELDKNPYQKLQIHQFRDREGMVAFPRRLDTAIKNRKVYVSFKNKNAVPTSYRNLYKKVKYNAKEDEYYVLLKTDDLVYANPIFDFDRTVWIAAVNDYQKKLLSDIIRKTVAQPSEKDIMRNLKNTFFKKETDGEDQEITKVKELFGWEKESNPEEIRKHDPRKKTLPLKKHVDRVLRRQEQDDDDFIITPDPDELKRIHQLKRGQFSNQPERKTGTNEHKWHLPVWSTKSIINEYYNLY